MKKLTSFIAVVLFTVILLTSCSSPFASSDEDKIEECIEGFTTAYNEGDIEEAMEYMTGKTKNSLESILGLLGIFTGYDVSKIFSGLFSLGVGFGGTGHEDYLNVKIIDIEVEEDKAVANAKISFDDVMSDSSEISNCKFQMVKKDGKWFISDITD